MGNVGPKKNLPWWSLQPQHWESKGVALLRGTWEEGKGTDFPVSVKMNKITVTLVVACLLFICLRPRHISSSLLIFVSGRLFSCVF